MTRRETYRPQARVDIVELAGHIAEDSLDAALRFLDSAEDTICFLAQNTRLGAIYPTTNTRLPNLRVFQVRKFPKHLIFYFERDHGIEIVRVLHGSRNIEVVLRLE